MFDIAWPEIMLIGVVALIAIGPKDLPVAIKTVANMIKKARRMAGEFQGHVDEMVREANLHEVRDQITQLRSFNIKNEIAKAVDDDGSLRATFAQNPLKPDISSFAPDPPEASRIIDPPAEPVAPVEAPAFVPPESGGTPAPYVPKPPPQPPAFLPPGTTLT